MVDVVLINSPIVLYRNRRDMRENLLSDGDEKSFYPMNILYLAAYLEEKGHTVSVVDAGGCGLTLAEIKKKVDELSPKLVGISAMTISIQSALIMAKELKKKGRLIGLGGVHLTCDPDFLNRFANFDFGVVGDGEVVLERLVRKVKAGKPVKGLYQGEPIEDLDKIPFPARHLIDHKIYHLKKLVDDKPPAAGILASRGCPFDCVFCSIPARGKKVRYRSAKNIVDEMELIYDQCQGSYSFTDDCFIVNRPRVMAFCQEIIDRGLKINWVASTRADSLDLKLAKMLKRAGCTELFFGVESGNERIRNKVIGKRLSYESIEKAVSVCRKVGILSDLFLMVGLPTETKREMLDTVRIGGKVKADIVGIHIATPLPGSRLYKYAIDNKIIPADIVDQFASGKLGRKWRGNYPLFVPKGEKLSTLVWMKRLTYLYFYLSPFWWWRRIHLWKRMPSKFGEDLELFKMAGHVLLTGGTKGQLS